MIASRARARTLPPGPRGLPLLGVTPELRADPLRFLERTAHSYGPISHFRLSGTGVYQVNDPDAIGQVLQDDGAWGEGLFGMATVRPVRQAGLPDRDGEPWLRRPPLARTFHARHLPYLAEAVASATRSWVGELEQRAAREGAVDIEAELLRLMRRLAARTLFASAAEAEAAAMERAVGGIFDDLDCRLEIPLLLGPKVPAARNRRLLAAVRRLDRMLDRVIDDRLRRAAPGEEHSGDPLALLLGGHEEATGEGMSRPRLRQEVLSLLTAGSDAAARLLAFCLHLLGTHPDVESRLRAELAKLGDRPPAGLEAREVPYARAVLQESARLYPPAWVTARECKRPDMLCGYSVPQGSTVWISPWVMQRRGDYWPNPECFDPGRFLDAPARPRHAYIPFGGSNLCLGRGFALLEAAIVLSSLLHRFRVQLVDERRPSLVAGATLRPAAGLRVRLWAR